MTSLYMHYALCFVHVEHSVCHEPISVLINILYIYIYINTIEQIFITKTGCKPIIKHFRNDSAGSSFTTVLEIFPGTAY